MVLENPSPKDISRLIKEVALELKNQLSPLIVCTSHSWGGLEQVAAQDALELGELGFKTRVLVFADSPTHQKLLESKSATPVPIDYKPRNHFDFKFKRDIDRWVGSGVSLIHTHQTTLMGSLAPWLYRHPQIPLFASRHIMSGHSKKDPYHRFLYNRLDKLLVMSQALKENVIKTHPLRERQVKVVNLGLDFRVFDPEKVSADRQRAVWGADRDTVVIGLVGRIDPAKGQDTLIRAAAGLASHSEIRDGNHRFKFVIVGEETLGSSAGFLQELKKMVAQFGLEPQVEFAGYQTNIPEIMKAFDIVVMPSRQEAFGLVAIEAMAMESAVIISSGGSAYEITGGGKYGLSMRPDDAFDLQRQLRALILDPKLRHKIGRQSREHVMARYDRKVRLLKTLQLYERAFRRRKSSR